MRQVFGAILLGGGILVAVLSCLLALFLLALDTPHGGVNVERVLAIGGIPLVAGIALFAGGWLLLKKRRQP